MKFGSWSVIHAFGAVYELIAFSTSASAISDNVVCLSSTATEYLVANLVLWVYTISLLVVGSNSTISIDTLSKVVPDVSVRIIGYWVFTWTSFFNWQFRCFVYRFIFPISYLIRNNYDEFFYKFFVMPLWSPMTEAWFSVINLFLSDTLGTWLSDTVIFVEEL